MKCNATNTFFLDIAIILYVVCACLKDADPAISDVIAIPVHYIGYVSVLFSILS